MKGWLWLQENYGYNWKDGYAWKEGLVTLDYIVEVKRMVTLGIIVVVGKMVMFTLSLLVLLQNLDFDRPFILIQRS